MRHIMVLNPKGGAGKTTIAINLATYFAIQGANVVLADLDPQGSSMAWLSLRSSGRRPIQGIAAYNSPLRPARKAEYIIMDTPAAVHGRRLSDLVRRAETIIIPVLPSPIDMRAASDFIKEIRNVAKVVHKRAKLALVANRVRENTVVHWQLDEFLTRQRIPFFLTTLRDSQNYIRAAQQGLGIFEMAVYATAVDREQWDPIFKWIKSKRSQP